MGEELVSDLCPANSQEDGGGGNTSLSISEYFYKCLPYYLSIGMTWDNFWKDDVSMAKVYREKEKIDRQRKNNELWLEGFYFYKALELVVPAMIPFNKNPKIDPYLDEPIALTKEEQEEREFKKNQESLWKLRELLQKSSERK